MNRKLQMVLRGNFLAFARKAIVERDGTEVSDDRYIDYLAAILMDFVGGVTRRLLINLPPRHLKTMLCTVCLAAWILAHRPKTKILVVTYCADLAETIARAIRDILQAAWFKETFDTRLKKGHAKVTDFATTAGGGVFAVSVDGNVTGHGGDVIIFDDPHNIDDAGNPDRLALTISKFQSVVKSRLNNQKKGRILVVAHRVHENDLSARLLPKRKWERLVLPYIATHDEDFETENGLWRRRKGDPLRFDAMDLDEVEELKQTLINPDFDMLFQQDSEGQALPPLVPDDFRGCTADRYRDLPKVLSVDAGFGDSEAGSFSVVQVWAKAGTDHFLVDQFREHCEFYDLARATRILAKRHRASHILVEAAANGPALISELTRKQRGKIVAVCPRGRKTQRLRPHYELFKLGRIHVSHEAAFRTEFVAEFVAFPHGPYSDQVDACTQYLSWIQQPGITSVPTPEPQRGIMGRCLASQPYEPVNKDVLKGIAVRTPNRPLW
jgi:predicted phage terminase large subunit-like protein